VADEDVSETQRDIARAERELAETERRIADTEGDIAEAQEEIAETEQELAARQHADDPLLDTAVRRAVAGADEHNPFGQPGRPMSRRSPFFLGFFGGLGLAAAYLLVRALGAAHQVLVLVVVSMFLAVGLNPAIERLSRLRLGRRGAIAVVFTGVILFFAGFSAAIVPPLVDQAGQLNDSIPSYLDRLNENDRIHDLDEEYHFIDKAKKSVEDGDFGANLFGGFVGVGKIVLGAVFSALTILILTLYFASALPAIKRVLYLSVPRSRRARFGLLTDEILNRIGGYVSGALTIAFVAGTSTLIFLEIVRVPYAVALALVVAVTDLVPLVGATIGAVAVTGVAFFDSTTKGLLCAAFFLIYQQVENYLIYPRIMARTVNVHPAATIVAALIGGTLLGVVGALLAIPTAAAVQLIIQEVVIPRQDQN